MRVHLGTDHAGRELKDHLVAWLTARGDEPIDHGAFVHDPTDDYPPYVMAAAAAVVSDPGSLGIVIGGSGNGEAIAANKVDGVRAALVWNVDTARLGREHNDANVCSIGARMHTTQDATAFVDVFLSTAFSGAERHVRRLAMITAYERTAELPTP
jgi:ribose 5-phosphate isomerase B